MSSNYFPRPPAIGTIIDYGTLELVSVLGYGGYGVVYRAVDLRSPTLDGPSYAVKCLLHTPTRNPGRQRRLHMQEIALHQLASVHPNVVTLHRVIEEEDCTFIVMDYSPDGDLKGQILQKRRYLGRDDLIKHVFLQLLDAVNYCHSLGIYHRDLKPENVLCFNGGLRLALTDFGLATAEKVSEEFRTGSVYHMSPECQGGSFAPGGTYSPPFNDIWSLGILLLNLITGRNPWKSASASDPTFQAYLQDPGNFLPSILPISAEVNEILLRTLEIDWRNRISISELRRAIKGVTTFYADDVVFEDAMARCSWEAGFDITGGFQSEVDSLDLPPHEQQQEEARSAWSRESSADMVFAAPSRGDSGSWVPYPASGATWGASQGSANFQTYDDQQSRSSSNTIYFPALSGPYPQDVDDQLDQVHRNHLRRWLSPSDPSINHNITRHAHHNGTAQWFFESSRYNQWKSSGSFLWVHGKPGSGKSVLCSSIIQDIMALRDSGKASMAYFYFYFRDVDKQRLHNLLPSLLCQLSAGSDPCWDILLQLYSANDRGVQRPSDRAMIECLEEMLTLETQHPTYIIVDALDECPTTISIPSPRDELLRFVAELVNLRLPNLHICVTSRLEHDIQVVLEHLTPHPVTLHDESGQQQDVADYVTSFVHSNERMRKWPEADKDLVIKLLLEKADGMFSWVFCQLEVLQHALPSSIRQVLEELPESLDEKYERILREIRKPYQEHAPQLLHCLAAAVRPLRVEEIAEVLAIDFNMGRIPKLNLDWRSEDPEEAVMSACSSLVIIVKDGDSWVVRFSHSSVKQFLTSNRLAEPIRDVSYYHIQLETAHLILAQSCLGVLLQFDDRVDRDNIEGFPLARYAAQYWATHARVGDASSRIKDGMECLFDADKPCFYTWLWIYNEDRGGHSMSTIGPTKPEAVPLYYAARLGFQDLAEHLIAKYPELVNARSRIKMTPMHAAASGGHINILRLLQGHGADVGSRNKYGETPLHGASWSGKLDAGQCLLDLGADINARNDDDWTPLFHAVFHGHTEFAQMLLERGAAIEARSVFRSTALHAAVRGGKVQAVRFLLEHGADVNARDNRGWTPSRWKSTEEIVKLLAEHGAETG